MPSHLPSFPAPPVRLTTAISITLLLILAGCAQKPWQDPVADDGRQAMLEVIDTIIETQNNRPDCFDADVKIFLTSWIKNRAASGYTQILAPDTVKFVTSNPFGQPIFAFVGNRQNFQYVNTLTRRYLDGDITEFANLYEIPFELFDGSWGDWLSARIPVTIDGIVDMRFDHREDGVWLKYASATAENNGTGGHEYLLIQPDKKLLTARTITDARGKIIARIDYSNWTAPPLLQPQTIRVTELSYGAELEIRFSNLMGMQQCENQDFFIKRPAGYSYQHLTSAHY